MAIADRSVIDITAEAIEAVLGIRAQEPDGADLALTLAVTGFHGAEFAYELTFIPTADAADADVVQRFGELPVVIRGDSISRLEGAMITVHDGGLSIDNPNSASPKIPGGSVGLEGAVADRLRALLETRINPAIAGHGGFAELIGVEGDTAFLRLGGGCQGCGLAAVTLRQGIEVAIREAIPEIAHVIDVTDHEAGANPYYEAAKK